MSNKKMAVLTFGCQMNKYDSERVVGLMQAEDYEITDNAREADLVVVNTCAIREKSESKVFSQLGRLKGLKEKHPGTQIAVCGCVAQRVGAGFVERTPFVDVVIGTDNIEKLPGLLVQSQEEKRSLVDISRDSSFDEPSVIHRKSEFSAFVSIVKGCNHRCSYCIVPLTRGPERSRPSEIIIGDIRQLAEQGYREITLIGQNVNSYAADLPGEIRFSELLERVAGVNGIERVRFVTSHPMNFTDALIATIAKTEKVCKHLHLPVQSGSNRVLEMMNRDYTVEFYLDRIRSMRELAPDMSFTTDIIVGFPGETEDDFHRSVDLVEAVRYDSFFMFKYSPRPLTAAATMPDQIPDEVKQERFAKLQQVQQRITIERNARFVGRTEALLIEGPSKKDVSKLSGRNGANKVVNFPGTTSLRGQIVPVEIVRAGLHSLEGRLAVPLL